MSKPTTHEPSDEAAGGTALLILDMVSLWDFPNARPLFAAASTIAPRIAALQLRCRRAGVPVIFANDNRGRWRSDFRQLVTLALAAAPRAAALTRRIAPEPEDYFVLKPKHSAFFATPLDLLLRHLRARRLILVGVATDQCVPATASDARMREFDVVIPRDCVAAETAARGRAAIRHFEQVMQVATTPSPRLRFGAIARRKPSPLRRQGKPDNAEV